MKRLIGVLVCAAVLVAPAAAGATTVRFHAGTDRARVSVTDGRTAERGSMELVRGGVVIARSAERNGMGAAGGHVTLPSIVAGDVVNAYANGALIATATYDGLPALAGACAGRRSFTVRRGEGATTTWVGVGGRRAPWEDAAVFRVSAEAALRSGQTVSVITTRENVIARRDTRVGACGPVEPAPSDAEVRRATRRAVSAAAARLRRTERRVMVPFAFLEPGSVRLELKAGSVVVGTCVETVAKAGRARLTIALRRRAAGRLTLTATFVPARAGGQPQTASALTP